MLSCGSIVCDQEEVGGKDVTKQQMKVGPPPSDRTRADSKTISRSDSANIHQLEAAILPGMSLHPLSTPFKPEPSSPSRNCIAIIVQLCWTNSTNASNLKPQLYMRKTRILSICLFGEMHVVCVAEVTVVVVASRSCNSMCSSLSNLPATQGNEELDQSHVFTTSSAICFQPQVLDHHSAEGKPPFQSMQVHFSGTKFTSPTRSVRQLLGVEECCSAPDLEVATTSPQLQAGHPLIDWMTFCKMTTQQLQLATCFGTRVIRSTILKTANPVRAQGIPDDWRLEVS